MVLVEIKFKHQQILTQPMFNITQKATNSNISIVQTDQTMAENPEIPKIPNQFKFLRVIFSF